MEAETLLRRHSLRVLVKIVFIVAFVVVAAVGVGLFLGVPRTLLTVVLLAGAGLTLLTKHASSWPAPLPDGVQTFVDTLSLQLLKLLIVGGTVLAGGEEIFAHSSFYNRLLGLVLVPFAAVVLGLIISYETITVLLRWRNPNVPTFPSAGSRWYVLLRGIEVIAAVVGLVIIFYGFSFFGEGPLPVPAGVYIGLIIIEGGLVVMAGTVIRVLGELFLYIVSTAGW